MGSNYGFNQAFSFQSCGFGNAFSSSSSTSPPISLGLVLHYEVSNADSYAGSGATIVDLAGNSNATLYNSPSYSDGYIEFNGSNQYLITDTSLASKVTSDITSISVWAYPMDNGVILAELGSTTLNDSWHDSQIEMVGGTTKFRFWDGTLGGGSVTSNIATPLNAWYNFAMVYDGTTMFVYVNGQPAGSVVFSRQNPVENGQGLHYTIAGTDSTNLGDGSYANMRFGQLLIYSQALSANEVQQNFDASRKRYGL